MCRIVSTALHTRGAAAAKESVITTEQTHNVLVVVGAAQTAITNADNRELVTTIAAHALMHSASSLLLRLSGLRCIRLTSVRCGNSGGL